jgi:galactokinase
MENEKRFSEVFQVNAERSYFSPGRVNLIGEHTDYNGGNVFPCALTIGTYGVVSLRKDSMIRIDYYRRDGEWTGAHYLDELPNDLDKFALSMLNDYFADYYRVRLE